MTHSTKPHYTGATERKAKAEARKELDMLDGRGEYNNPGNPCWNDGIFAQSIILKYGCSLETLQKEVVPHVTDELKTKRHARALGRTFKKRDAPAKTCFCGIVIPNGTRICPECGHVFFQRRNNPSPFKGVPNEDRGNHIGDFYCD